MDAVLRASLLRFSPHIPGVNYPMAYVGSRNSFFCWHVEDNLLYAASFLQARHTERLRRGYVAATYRRLGLWVAVLCSYNRI
eukprot:1584580-Pleurochrysis_carterae.AAC.1